MTGSDVKSTLSAFKLALSQEELALHRQTFIHFSKNLAGNSPEVIATTQDGKNYQGVYNTMTPFPKTDFKVCLRGARTVVCTFRNDTDDYDDDSRLD